MNYLQLVLFLLYIYKILSSSVDFIQILLLCIAHT